MALAGSNAGKEFPFRLYVTPEDEVVEALAAQINGARDAYKVAVRWTYVSEQKLNHIAMDLIPDDKLSDLLENAFGVPLNEGDKMQPPFDMLRGIQLRVLWDRGRLDLRILNRLENEIDSIAVINHAQVALANLIIIPRSSETIAKQLKEISGSGNQA